MCLVLVTQVFGAMRTYERNGLYYAREDYEASGEYLAYVAGPDDEDENQSYAGLTSVVIPDTVVFDGIVYTVVGIYDEAFLDCQNLASVTFSNSLRTIGGSAFRGCTGLDSIVIPNGVISIGNDAFNGCSGLASIVLPASRPWIGENAFYGCNNLTLIIATGATEISGSAFSGCDFKAVVIPEGVKIIGQDAFRECHNLVSVSLPSTLETIGNKAFNECAIDSIVIPASVKTIADNAFDNCRRLKTVVFEGAVENFGTDVFYVCDSLKYNKYGNCRYLGNTANPYLLLIKAEIADSHRINDSTKSIVYRAFSDIWDEIDSLAVPAGVKYIGNYAFEHVKNLYYKGSATGSPWGAQFVNPVFDGDFIFSGEEKTILAKYTGEDSEITIPDGVVEIGKYAFENKSITSVTMTNSVKTIGERAFEWCSNLKTVVLSDSLESIGENAFAYCRSLSTTTIPDGVSTIGNYAFENVLDIQYHGTASGSPWGAKTFNAFADGDFLYSDSTKTEIAKYFGTDSVVTIPAGVTEIGTEAFRDNDYIKTVVMDSALVSIANNAFCDCRNLQSVSLNDGLKSIGSYCFANCRNLKEITIPDGVETIDYSAFSDGVQYLYYNGIADGSPWGATFVNPAIENRFVFTDSTKTVLVKYIGTDSVVTIPAGVTEIGTEAFKENQYIKSVVMDSALESIANTAFNDCSKLESVSLNDDLKSIGSYCFANCRNLKEITIPDGVETIDYSAFGDGVQYIFYNGTADGSPWGARFVNPTIDGDFVYSDSTKTVLNLYLGSDSEVTIPNGVVEISERAFAEKSQLTSVVIPETVKTIGNNAFCNCGNLRNVQIPSSIETMGYDLFSWSWNVTIVCDFASKPDSWPWNWNGDGNVVWKKAPLSITIYSSEYGTVTGYNPDSTYHYGDTLTLTATANPGYYFDRWSDWEYENPRTIIVANNIELSAEFYESEPVDVSVRSKNTFLGTVAGFDPDKTYYPGDTLKLTATPVGEFGFMQWSDGNTDNPRTVIVDGETTLVAEFEEPFELADNSGWGSIGSFAELTKNDDGKTTQVDLSFSNSGNRWDAQFVTPSLTNLGNEGDAFELSFDVKYSGKFDEGQFTIVAGKTIPYNAEYDQANNTQIVDEDGYSLSWGREFTVEKEWTRVSYNYYLGAEGADSVRLEFDLGTHAGTYSFKNIVLKVAGNTADRWFCQGGVFVNAIAENGTVTGAGFYNNGDTAVLYASANDFYIFKQWSDGNTDNPRQVIVNNDTTFTAKFVSDGSIQIPYLSKVNTWSYDGWNIDKAYVKDNIVSIFVPEFSDEWSAQFCNILTGLDGQEVGNNFQLDFEVNWNGLESDSAKIYLLAGKVTGGLHEDYQWSDSIAELVNAEGTIDGIRYAGYDIANGEWTHVSWGGIITETGAKYIGIEMNLGMTEENGDNRGTFNFKNMTMTINNNMVKYNYVEDDKVIVSLSASKKNCGTLSGSGIYNAGDTVTIAATPNDGYEFKQWSDGSTDNPHTFVAAEDLWLVAQIIDIPGPYAGKATILPGNLEAENFDNGDSTHYEIYLGTSYDGYRDTDAGIDKIGDNEYALSWTTEGEWADYTVTVAEEQKMRWAARVSTYIYDSAKVAIYKDEAPVTGTIEAPKTGSWYRYDFVSGETQFALPEGTYKLRVNFEKEDCNIDKVMFGKLSDVLVTAKVNKSGEFNLPSHASIGFVSGYGFYNIGDTVTLTATANEGYTFKQWSDGNTNATRTIIVESDTAFAAEFGVTERLYEYAEYGFGKWFTHGNNLYGLYTNQNNEAVAMVEEAGNPWDAQFCVIFHEAEGQTEGNSFQLEFDVMWEGNNTDTSAIHILSGKSNADFGVYTNYQWNAYDDTTNVEKNTELIFDGGFWAGHNKEYRLPYGEWQHISWGGTIGEKGNDYIGLQINLLDDNEGLYLGTYRFKNVIVKMNNQIVARDFYNGNANLLVSASGENGTVTGGGYYGKGDEVKLTATPNEGYLFKQWSDGNTRNPRTITVNGNMTFVAEFVVDDSNPLSFFGETNTWFVSGTTVDRAYEKDNIASLFVSEYCDQWLAQFCNILTGLDGQEAGNNFQLDFDVNWNGLDSDKATIYLLAGKVEGGIHEDYQWSDSIAELVNAEGTVDGIRYAGYDLADGKWTHVSWGGIITETGAEYVGIEINLGMKEADGDNRGAFNFKNMKVRINGEVVKQDFCTGELLVNATAGENGTVTGAGFYTKGDTATITAIADEYYYFKQWSDGNSDNPRTFVVNDDMSFTAEFATNAVNIPYYAESDSINAWYVNGSLVKKAITADNIASITVSENGNLWESQFCNILSGLDGQEAGSKFQLDFDVNWNSLSGADKAQIMMVTGKSGYGDRYSDDENTELVNDNGNFNGIQYATYEIANKSWTHISWGGTIGEKGADYIGVGIYFNKFDEEADKRGTFNFKNMKVRINGEVVKQDFCTGELFVNATAKNGTVTGAGYYTKGDTATLAVTPYDGCIFKQWSDGNTDNPRTFVVNDDASFVAEIEREEVNYTSADYPFNTWWTSGSTADSVQMGASGYAAKISISEEQAEGDRWDVQFCNIFHQFDGQVEGNNVKLSFDVKFEGAADTATITFVTGKITWSLNPEIHEDYQWTDDNTEIVDEYGYMVRSFEYDIEKGKWQNITIEGKIGEKGAKYIGIELDLAGNAGNTNNVGDFYFKNMTLSVNGNIVTSDYEVIENTKKSVLVIANNESYGNVSGTGTYNFGDTVTATANAFDGCEFLGWSDGSTSNPYSFVVTKDVKLTANFQKKAVVVETFTVSVAADSTFGSVRGAGTYKLGDTATIVALENDGYEFIGWSDGNTSNPYSFVVTKDVKLTANFQKKTVVVETFTVSVAADSTLGSILGDGIYSRGDTATITAIANDDCEFTGWSDGSTSNPYSFVVTKDVKLTANFQKKTVVAETFTVSVAADSTLGSVLGSGTYKLGDTATIVALENDGYEFTGWSDGNTSALRTIVVTADVKLTALFRKRFNPERTVDGLVFFLTDTSAHTAELIGLADSLTVLDAPAEIKIEGVAYQVTGIGNKAFAGCTQLDSINIPESIETIGIEAFANCTGTVSIVIPNTVDSIGYNAFLNVKNIVYEGNATGSPWGALTVNGTFDGDYIYDTESSLTVYTGTDAAVVIPDEVSTIGHNAFAGNETVTSVEIPESVTEIGDGAFNGCSNLESVELPKSVESIGNETFANCTSLESVEIPESVKEIGGSAFNGCSSLTAIQIPVSVTVIGQSAFANCSKLDAVEIPESVNELGDGAFTNCTSLVSVSIPVSVTVIGAETFSGCSSLNSIDIPSATTEIGNNAFDGCSSLTTISIPVSVTTIGNGAFAYCNSLVTVQIGTFINVKNEGVSTLADGSVSIGSRAFIGCDSLTAVYIPLSVASIGDSAFAGCKNLTIYCEAESMPEGWSESWNPEGCKVVWNYNGKPQVVEFNLIAIANNSRYGSVTGSATYTKGATATITATAAEGYKFVGWSDGNTDNPRTVVVTGDLAFTAVFESVTAIDDEAAAAVNIFAYSNTIVVENADSNISVYDANGRLIATEQPAGQRTEILIANKGVYLVKVGSTAKRVMVF